MLLDGLLLFSQNQDLTQLAANAAAPSTNVIDLTNPRDLGTADQLFLFGVFTTLPSAGATFTAALQTSPDNVNWTTAETYSVVTVAPAPTVPPFMFRQQLPILGSFYRYMRMLYTTSQALTQGQFEAGLTILPQVAEYYPRNFTA